MPHGAKGGSPLLQQGEPDFRPAEKWLQFKRGFSPGNFEGPALKRNIKFKAFFGALKRSFFRINAGAPTWPEPQAHD